MKTFYLKLLFAITPFLSISQYDINGNASQSSCNCYDLTNASNGQVGSVWNVNQINLNTSFDFEFEIYLGNNNSGADGMVFGLQPINTSVGVSGNGMGLSGITPSLGVYIDTYQNGADGDPFDDHISLNQDGDVNHNTANNLSGPFNLSNVEDGNWHNLHVVWDANSFTMSVEFDGVSQFQYTGNIVANIFGGNPSVYWGFTAATGGLNNEHKFCTQLDANFTMDSEIICPNTELEFVDDTESFGGISSWEWDIDNDGTIDYTGSTITHTFTTLGTFPVTLTVTDDNLCTSEQVIDVTVAEPDVTINSDFMEVCSGESVNLSAELGSNFTTCYYTIELIDSWPDGWNGNTLDVYLDGVLAGNYTLSDPPGDIQSFQIDVSGATTISFNYNATGSFTSENELKVYNNLGILVFDNQDIDLLSNPIYQEDITTCPIPDAIYSWSPNDMVDLPNESIVESTILTSTTFSVTVVLNDDENCIATKEIEIVAKPNPEIVEVEKGVCFDSGETVLVEEEVVDANSSTSSIGTVLIYTDPQLTELFNDLYAESPGEFYVYKEVNGCTGSNKIILENVCEPEIQLPNVFTPTASKGTNDIFAPLTFDFVGEHQFTVFNRWGKIVYSTHNIMLGWDGKAENGKNVSAGTYYYELQYKDEQGLEYDPISGHISIF